MKVTIEFNGMLRQLAGWKNKIEFELDEGATISSALSKIDIEPESDKRIGFATLNNKKVGFDSILDDGDAVKVFPRAFGG